MQCINIALSCCLSLNFLTVSIHCTAPEAVFATEAKSCIGSIIKSAKECNGTGTRTIKFLSSGVMNTNEISTWHNLLSYLSVSASKHLISLSLSIIQCEYRNLSRPVLVTYHAGFLAPPAGLYTSSFSTLIYTKVLHYFNTLMLCVSVSVCVYQVKSLLGCRNRLLHSTVCFTPHK